MFSVRDPQSRQSQNVKSNSKSLCFYVLIKFSTESFPWPNSAPLHSITGYRTKLHYSVFFVSGLDHLLLEHLVFWFHRWKDVSQLNLDYRYIIMLVCWLMETYNLDSPAGHVYNTEWVRRVLSNPLPPHLLSTTSRVRCSSSLLDFSLLLIISRMVTVRLNSRLSLSIFSYDASSFLRFWHTHAHTEIITNWTEEHVSTELSDVTDMNTIVWLLEFNQTEPFLIRNKPTYKNRLLNC